MRLPDWRNSGLFRPRTHQTSQAKKHTYPNAIDFSNTRSSSDTNVRFKETGVRAPIVTGHDDFVQNGDGRGSSGFTPLYTSRRCTHGMSFGPPTLHVYFSVSEKSRSSYDDVPFVASARTALGLTALLIGKRRDLGRPVVVEPGAPRQNTGFDRGFTRPTRASREATGATRASGADNIVPTRLMREANEALEDIWVVRFQ